MWERGLRRWAGDRIWVPSYILADPGQGGSLTLQVSWMTIKLPLYSMKSVIMWVSGLLHSVLRRRCEVHTLRLSESDTTGEGKQGYSRTPMVPEPPPSHPGVVEPSILLPYTQEPRLRVACSVPGVHLPGSMLPQPETAQCSPCQLPGGQVQDLRSVCELGGLFQMRQDEVTAGVIF